MTLEFKLPDIGEGVSEGEIVRVLVKEGDKVNEDTPLVEVMTDKVNVQIPSPVSGSVSKVAVKEGDSVKVGQVLMVLEEERGAAVSQPEQHVSAPAQMPPEPRMVAPSGGAAAATSNTTATEMVLATPAVRKLAKELGVELTRMKGSGPGGRIVESDVRAAAQAAPPTAARAEELVPLKGVRRMVAEHVVKSRDSAATVTHVDEVDVSELVLLREAFKGSAEKRGVKLTYLPFVIKALLPALKEFPFVNATLDEQAGNIVLKKYYNIGIATDTEQGLVVPVVKDVDRKDIYQLASEIEALSQKARSGTLSLEEIRSSTFTITNVGSIGGLFATPIINWPEVAILGMHKIAKRPVVRNGAIEARDMTYLSLSFDHRVMDGAYAARFLARVIEVLQDPKKLLSEVL